MSRCIVTALLVMLAASAFAADTPKTEEEKTLYAVGLTAARQLSVFNLTPAEQEVVRHGLMDGMSDKAPDVDLGAYKNKIQELARARRTAQGEKMAAANQAFLAEAATEKGALKTDSGLIYLSLKEGRGAGPGPNDSVKVTYRGTRADGKEVDSSDKSGQAAEFRMNGVIKCWSEGLQMMKPGGKAKLVCPSTLAYGETGKGYDILPGAPLVFEVELLEVKK